MSFDNVWFRTMDRSPVRVGSEVLAGGIDFGSTPVVEAFNKDIVVLHVKGSMYWTGIGLPRAYGPTERQVWRVKQWSEENTSFTAEQLISYQTRKPKR